MSFNYSLENIKQINDVYVGKKGRYHPYGRSRRNSTILPDDTDSFLNHHHSNPNPHRKHKPNKKTQQFFDLCNGKPVKNSKELDELEGRFNSSDSEMDVEITFGPTIPYNQIQDQTYDHLKIGGILEECCKKTPEIDEETLNDFSIALDNPPKDELRKLALDVQDLPYEGSCKNLQMSQAMKSLMVKGGWNQKNLILHLRDVRYNILGRCSYGFFIINKKKDHFLAVTNCHGQGCRSAPKGHPKMKVNGQLETPFETAVREVTEEIHYWDPKSEQYRTLDEKLLKEYVVYLECIFKGKESGYRRIGLFLVCLQDDIHFSPNDQKEIKAVNWVNLEDQISPGEFYTIYPFVKYLRKHPELLSGCKVD